LLCLRPHGVEDVAGLLLKGDDVARTHDEGDLLDDDHLQLRIDGDHLEHDEQTVLVLLDLGALAGVHDVFEHERVQAEALAEGGDRLGVADPFDVDPHDRARAAATLRRLFAELDDLTNGVGLGVVLRDRDARRCRGRRADVDQGTGEQLRLWGLAQVNASGVSHGATLLAFSLAFTLTLALTLAFTLALASSLTLALALASSLAFAFAFAAWRRRDAVDAVAVLVNAVVRRVVGAREDQRVIVVAVELRGAGIDEVDVVTVPVFVDGLDARAAVRAAAQQAERGEPPQPRRRAGNGERDGWSGDFKDVHGRR